MIRIRDEIDLAVWLRKNYMQLGFSKILKDNKGRFPDFIFEEEGARIRAELEVFASNFIQHKHNIKKVDKVICAFNDVKLGVPVVKIQNVKLIKFNQKTPLSPDDIILKTIIKERIVTSSDIAKVLKVSWNTADRYLIELFIEGKIIRIKKEGVNLWLKK